MALAPSPLEPHILSAPTAGGRVESYTVTASNGTAIGRTAHFLGTAAYRAPMRDPRGRVSARKS